MITYSSYNPPTFPVISNVLTVAFCNCGTELFAGACVFSILGVSVHACVCIGLGAVVRVLSKGVVPNLAKARTQYLTHKPVRGLVLCVRACACVRARACAYVRAYV
jgi:hypothetical protein